MICEIKALCWTGGGYFKSFQTNFYIETTNIYSELVKFQIGNFLLRKDSVGNTISINLVLNSNILLKATDKNAEIPIRKDNEFSILFRHDRIIHYIDENYLAKTVGGEYRRYIDINEVLKAINIFKDKYGNQVSYIIDEGNRIEEYDWNSISRCFKRNDNETLAIIECLYWDSLSSTPIERKFCISTNLSQVSKYKAGNFFHDIIENKFFLILDCIMPENAIWMDFKLIKSENLLPILEHSSNVERLNNEFLIQDGDFFNVEYYSELDDFLEKLEYQNPKKEIRKYCKGRKPIENSTWLEVKDRFLFKSPLERISIEKINTSVEVSVARWEKEKEGCVAEKFILNDYSETSNKFKIGNFLSFRNSNNEVTDLFLIIDIVKRFDNPELKIYKNDEFFKEFVHCDTIINNHNKIFNYNNESYRNLGRIVKKLVYFDRDHFKVKFNSDCNFADKNLTIPMILNQVVQRLIDENKTKILTNYAPSISLDDSKYYKDMNGNFVMSSAEIVYGENNDKKEKNMFNNLMKNFKFGKMDTDTIKHSFNGIAFQTEDGDYVVYNPDMTFTNVSEMVMDIPIYVMPVSKSNIKIGDIIIHNGEFVIVQSIENKEIRVARPRTREVIGIIPEKSIFGFDFYTKVIDFTKNFNSGASSSNPFGNLPMLMMMDNKDNNNDILMLMMMNGGRMDINNPMFMYMMMSKSDDKSNLLPLMMLINQNKRDGNEVDYNFFDSEANFSFAENDPILWGNID